MNKLFKYFSLFFLLMVCNYTNVQAIDINGNLLKNADFTQKDTTPGRYYMPSDWNINQLYPSPPQSTPQSNRPDRVNKGTGVYGDFYWKFSNPTGITVENTNTGAFGIGVFQEVDAANVTLADSIIIGGTVDLAPTPLRDKAAVSRGLAIKVGNINKSFSDPDVHYNPNTGRFITEIRPDDSQKKDFAKNGFWVSFTASPVVYISYESYSTPIMWIDNVFVVQQSLDVSTTKINVPLGSEISKNMVEEHITSVKLLEDGETTELDSYSIDDIVTSNSMPTNIVGSGETIVNITGIKDGKEVRGIASIPTEVTWGNDISLGGFTDPVNESTLALSLINDGNNTKIVGTYGDNTKHDRPIHSDFLDEDYYQIDYFPRETSSPLNLTNDLTEKGTKSLTLKGKQTPADAVEGWGTQVAKEGDIIRVWMKEPKINWYQNGERQDQLSEFSNRNLIYFEVTKDGFKPLYNNQVKGKTNIPINQGTSKETLDARYRDNPRELLDIPEQAHYEDIQYIDGQFKTYPDTSTIGTDRKSNIMMIGQTKNNFGELNITFDVNPTFDVVEQQESLEIETSDMSVPLGTEIDTDQVKEHITSVKLLEDGKTTELDSYSIDDIVTSDSIPTNVVGSGETIVNIIGIKDGKEIRGVASIPTEVTWGNDISLGGFTDPVNESTLALSLINDGNNTKIVGTYGDNTKHDRPIHSDFLDEDYYQIDYFPRETSSPLNLTNDLTEKGTKSLTLKGKQTPADAVEGWGTQVAKEGDIIRVWMKEEKINWYQNGNRQSQLSDFPNRNLIYFEVTNDGFKPLYNNQVKGKTNIPINKGTSKETLDARYRDNPRELLDIPEQANYEDIQYIDGQFKTYPDTSTIGTDRKSNIMMIGQTKNNFGELNITFDVNPTFDVVEQQTQTQMTINYYQLDRQGKETTHRVIDNLQTGNTVKAVVKEVEVGEKISDFIPQSDFDSYLYESSIVTNDVTNETIEDDIVPMDNFTVNRYYQPLENLSVPKTISFGDKNAQRLKDEYSVKNSPSPINLTSGFSDVNWDLHASSDGLFSEGTNTRLLSDMYFRLNNEKMIINKEDTVLASQVNKHYYDLPLVTEDNKEGLFLKIGNSGTKDSKYSGKIKFSMVTGP